MQYRELVREYLYRLPLVPPFNMITAIPVLVGNILHKCFSVDCLNLFRTQALRLSMSIYHYTYIPYLFKKYYKYSYRIAGIRRRVNSFYYLILINIEILKQHLMTVNYDLWYKIQNEEREALCRVTSQTFKNEDGKAIE